MQFTHGSLSCGLIAILLNDESTVHVESENNRVVYLSVCRFAVPSAYDVVVTPLHDPLSLTIFKLIDTRTRQVKILVIAATKLSIYRGASFDKSLVCDNVS